MDRHTNVRYEIKIKREDKFGRIEAVGYCPLCDQRLGDINTRFCFQCGAELYAKPTDNTFIDIAIVDQKDAIVDEAISTFGSDHQLRITQEELAELIQAISKHIRDRDQVSRGRLLDELVDVELMLYQVRKMFPIDENQYKRVLARKLTRLEDYINVQRNQKKSSL